MYRPRIEKLEDRRLFSVTDLIIDPFQARAAAVESGHEAAAIVDFVDADALALQFDGALRTESVSKDESITIGGNRTEGVAVGDVNGDGRATLLDGLDGGIWRNRITHTHDGDLYVGIDAGETIQLSTGEAAVVNTENVLAVLPDARNPDIEVENDAAHCFRCNTGIVTVGAAQRISVGSKSFLAMGDLNGNGTVDAADYFQSHTLRHANGLLLDVIIAPSIRTAGASNLVIVVCAEAPAGERLLPYIEQDNLYKISEPDRVTVSIVDGTSNTVMFGEYAGFVAALYRDLRNLSNDPSILRLTEDVSSVDVWEHASSLQHASSGGTICAFPDVCKQSTSLEPAASTNGIIAILIGLRVDPTNPNVVYVGGSRSSAFLTTDPQGPTYCPPQGADSCLADGSVRLLGTDNVETTPSILASDEYFSKFSNTTLDDEALLATTFGRGESASQVTHDEEFEKWASASRFDRGYLSLGYKLSDLLVTSIRAGRGGDPITNAADGNRILNDAGGWTEPVQSILHEDNEFSFPRMIR